MIVRSLVENNVPVRTRELSDLHPGISHLTFEAAVHYERGRLEAIEEMRHEGGPPEREPPPLTMVSILTLIDELCPLFDRIKDQATRHIALVSKSELAVIASEGQKLLDKWASGDESVRRRRGHVVPPRSRRREDSDESSLEADLERDTGPNR
jgi:hypothetical protein